MYHNCVGYKKKTKKATMTQRVKNVYNSPLFGVTTAKLYMYIYLYNLLFYQAGAKIDSVCQYHENIQMKGNSIK